MSLKSLPFLLALFFSFTASYAQSSSDNPSSDKSSIEKTIQNYFDGWMTGDTTLLGSAMHASCHLKFVKDDALVTINREDYLGRFKPRPKLENTEGRILNITITRNAASAKCEIERPDRLFTDYFNMLKIKDRWYIVDKISTSVAK